MEFRKGLIEINEEEHVGVRNTPMNEPEILNCPRGVMDPEIGENIVDLGLIQEVRFHNNGFQVHMGTTSPSCPLSGYPGDPARLLLTNQFPTPGQIEIEVAWELISKKPGCNNRAGGSGRLVHSAFGLAARPYCQLDRRHPMRNTLLLLLLLLPVPPGRSSEFLQLQVDISPRGMTTIPGSLRPPSIWAPVVYSERGPVPDLKLMAREPGGAVWLGGPMAAARRTLERIPWSLVEWGVTTAG